MEIISERFFIEQFIKHHFIIVWTVFIKHVDKHVQHS